MIRNQKGQFVKGCIKDYSGMRNGRLEAISYSHTVNNGTSRRTYWNFKCDCGNHKVLRVDTVFSKNKPILSCGCLKKEQDKLNLNRKGNIPKNKECIHSRKNVLYSRWEGIKRRCYNKNFSQYRDYGGRGIKVCEEWLYDFEAFYYWSINNGFKPELEIDRINNDGNYEPSNCRWVTHKENMNNRRCSNRQHRGNHVDCERLRGTVEHRE